MSMLISLVACVDYERPPALDVLVLTDRSDSVEDGTGSSCAGVVKILDSVLDTPGVDERSRVAVYGTGGPTGPALVPVIDHVVVPPGIADEAGTAGIIRSAVLRQAETACRASMTQVRVSRVVGALVSAGELLEGWGCRADHPCSLLVQSDMIDTESARRLRAGTLQLDLPEGLRVGVCRLDTGRGYPGDTQADQEWRATWERAVPGIAFGAACRD